MRKALTILEDARTEFFARPRLYLIIAACDILFVWTQDLVPLAGPVLCSIATTTLAVRLFTTERKMKMTPLVWLALLSFPLNVLWTILGSLHQNTSWDEPFSSAWSVPAIFFMILVYFPWARTVKLLSVDKLGLDTGLKIAWKETTNEIGPILWICLLMTVLMTLSYSTMGIGFLFAVPVGLAILKVTATSPAPERASEPSADRPRP